LPVLEIAMRTACVTAFRTLDLDDVGAHRRKTARHMRSRQEVAVVADADTREGQLLAGVRRIHDRFPFSVAGRRRIISLCSPFCTISPSWLISSEARFTM